MARQPVVKVSVGDKKTGVMRDVPEQEITKGNVRFSMMNMLMTGEPYVPKYREWTHEPRQSTGRPLSEINISPHYSKNGDLEDCDLEVNTSGEENAEETLAEIELRKRVEAKAKEKLREIEFERLVEERVNEELAKKKNAGPKTSDREEPTEVKVRRKRSNTHELTDIHATFSHKIVYDTDSGNEPSGKAQEKKGAKAKSDAESTKSDNSKGKKKKVVIVEDTEGEESPPAETDGEQAAKQKAQGKKGKDPSSPANAPSGGVDGFTPSNDAAILSMKGAGKSWADIGKAVGHSKNEVMKRHKELSAQSGATQDTAESAPAPAGKDKTKSANGETAGTKSGPKSPNDAVMRMVQEAVDERLRTRGLSPQGNRIPGPLNNNPPQPPQAVSGFPPPNDLVLRTPSHLPGPYNYLPGSRIYPLPYDYLLGPPNHPALLPNYPPESVGMGRPPFMESYHDPYQLHPSRRYPNYPQEESRWPHQVAYGGRYVPGYGDYAPTDRTPHVRFNDNPVMDVGSSHTPSINDQIIDGIRVVRIRCNTGDQVWVNGKILNEDPNGWHNGGSSARKCALHVNLHPGDILSVNGNRIAEPPTSWGHSNTPRHPSNVITSVEYHGGGSSGSGKSGGSGSNNRQGGSWNGSNHVNNGGCSASVKSGGNKSNHSGSVKDKNDWGNDNKVSSPNNDNNNNNWEAGGGDGGGDQINDWNNDNNVASSPNKNGDNWENGSKNGGSFKNGNGGDSNDGVGSSNNNGGGSQNGNKTTNGNGASGRGGNKGSTQNQNGGQNNGKGSGSGKGKTGKHNNPSNGPREGQQANNNSDNPGNINLRYYERQVAKQISVSGVDAWQQDVCEGNQGGTTSPVKNIILSPKTQDFLAEIDKKFGKKADGSHGGKVTTHLPGKSINTCESLANCYPPRKEFQHNDDSWPISGDGFIHDSKDNSDFGDVGNDGGSNKSDNNDHSAWDNNDAGNTAQTTQNDNQDVSAWDSEPAQNNSSDKQQW